MASWQFLTALVAVHIEVIFCCVRVQSVTFMNWLSVLLVHCMWNYIFYYVTENIPLCWRAGLTICLTQQESLKILNYFTLVPWWLFLSWCRCKKSVVYFSTQRITLRPQIIWCKKSSISSLIWIKKGGPGKIALQKKCIVTLKTTY